ncbi:MAG: hypothetical protein Q9227_005688 [Pyrenula ochraceoflavens]
MAEILGAAASVASLLQFSRDLYEIFKDAKEAPKDRQVIFSVLQSLGFVLEILEDRVKDSNLTWNRYVKKIEENAGSVIVKDSGLSVTWERPPKPKGPLADLYCSMEKISMKLSSYSKPNESRSRREQAGDLLWKFKKGEFDQLLTHIARAQGQIALILDQDDHELLRSIKSDTAETLNIVLTDRDRLEKKDIEKWLSPPDLQDEKQKVAHPFPSEKNLLATFEFAEWLKGQSWHLMCYGKPRSGKTVLSSLILNHLRQKFENSNIAVLCLFFSSKNPHNGSVEKWLGSLVKQLIQQQASATIPVDLRNDWKQANARDEEPTLEQLQKHLEQQLDGFDRAYLVLDAWDECPREAQNDMLQYLETEKLSKLFTSRIVDEDAAPKDKQVTCSVCGKMDLKIYFRCKICDAGQFDACWDCRQKSPACRDSSHTLKEPDKVVLDITPQCEVLKQYVRELLDKEIDPSANKIDERLNNRGGTTNLGKVVHKSDPAFSEEIVSTVAEKSGGCFLYARLFIKVLGQKRRKEMKATLKSFPRELEDVYEKTLERILQMAETQRNLGLNTLCALAWAPRPLTLDELREALGFRSDPSSESSDEDLGSDKQDAKHDILVATAGLVDISPHEDAVRLSHGSIKPLLRRKDIGEKYLKEAHIDLARACVDFLNKGAFSRPSASSYEFFETRLKRYPFVAYASQQWASHVHEAVHDPDVKYAAAQLLQNQNRINAFLQAQRLTDSSFSSWDVREGLHGLHVCAKEGLYDLISSVRQKQNDVNVLDDKYGETPLMLACEEGHLDVVGELLRLGADVNIVSRRGETALFKAISGERLKIINELLFQSQDVLDINAQFNQSEGPTRTALQFAIQFGTTDVISRLLDHPGIKVNDRDSDGLTALSLAAFLQDLDVVRILTAVDGVDVNVVDKEGRSALYYAADPNLGSVELVEEILRMNPDPDLADSDGSNAIMHALDGENLELVLKLLRNPPNPTSRDSFGCSVLHFVCEKDWPEVVKALLSKGFDPNMRDSEGLTPLHYAAKSGQHRVTPLLIEAGADRDIRSNDGITAAELAIDYGFEELGKTLQGGEGPSRERKPPVWRLARDGQFQSVWTAIESRKEDIFVTEPTTKNTALHMAAMKGKVEIVQLLLQAGMHSNALNRDHCTPLLLAVDFSEVAVVNVLLTAGANPNLADRIRQTPLILAWERRHGEILVNLIKNGAEIDSQRVELKDLLFRAVSFGSTVATEILLQNGADPEQKGPTGQIALQVAKENEHEDIVKLLSSREWSPDMQREAARIVPNTVGIGVDTSDQATDDFMAKLRGDSGSAIIKSVPSSEVGPESFQPRTPNHGNITSSLPYDWPEAPKEDPEEKQFPGRQNAKIPV